MQLVRAPGRVNLIGDHTDYNDGFVLPMTLGQAVYLGVRRRSDEGIRLHALNFDQDPPLDTTLHELPGVGTTWMHYVGGVIELARERGLPISGFEGVLYGDVPVGAGLSSSAATEVATLVALEALFGFKLDGVEAALLCQEVEHRFVGVQCGIMDQFASRLGRSSHALFLDCRTLEVQTVPVSKTDYCFVISDSRASRALSDSKYNERRGECEAGVTHFRRFDPSIQALRDVSADQLPSGADLPRNVQKRCRHVVEENDRVVSAVKALKSGDLDHFGELMSESHASLRDLYEVSSPDLDRLVQIAVATDGVLGARMTGAGFGGCTVTLVHRDAVPSLRARLTSEYYESRNREPAIYVVEHNVEAGVVSRDDR
jgi:galactokinase